MARRILQGSVFGSGGTAFTPLKILIATQAKAPTPIVRHKVTPDAASYFPPPPPIGAGDDAAAAAHKELERTKEELIETLRNSDGPPYEASIHEVAL